jgi:hypothetical protein
MGSIAEQLASDIDAALHGGQRSVDRYKRIIPLIEKAFKEVEDDLWLSMRED